MPDGPGQRRPSTSSRSRSPATTRSTRSAAARRCPPATAWPARASTTSPRPREFGEPATLCLAYDPASFATSAVRLLQFDGSIWVDVTHAQQPVRRARVRRGRGLRRGFAIAAAHSGVAPLVSIISGPGRSRATAAPRRSTFFADMDDSLIQCSIDGLPFAPCTSPVTYTHLEAGDHDFQVQAIGPFGIRRSCRRSTSGRSSCRPTRRRPTRRSPRARRVDRQLHQPCSSSPASTTRRHELELEFECSLDGGPFESCDAPEEVEVLTPGEHTFARPRRRRDGQRRPDAGDAHLDRRRPVRARHLDRRRPGLRDRGDQRDVRVHRRGGERQARERVRVLARRRRLRALQRRRTRSTGLTAGPHVFQVRAKDPDGNVDPTPDFYEWLIIGAGRHDRRPTRRSSSRPPATSGPDVLFGFASNELAETFECSLDGGAVRGLRVACTS